MRLFIEGGTYIGMHEIIGEDGLTYTVYVVAYKDRSSLEEVVDLTVHEYEMLSNMITASIEAACDGSRYLRDERLDILRRAP